jgi:DNA topoisomerase IB
MSASGEEMAAGSSPPRRIRRVATDGPGLTRVRAGRGFSYREPGGETVRDDEVLARIRALAIPPAWTDVWICPDPLGHLQATGLDAAGRRQYLYHERWRARREQQKFLRVQRFAEGLPELRGHVARDLERHGLPRERVLAGAVRLLDRGLFRIGGEGYAARNGSFGLATIRRRHLQIEGRRAEFRFRAKAGVLQVRQIEDPALMPLLRALKRRRGPLPDLLVYREGARWRDVRSGDINAYLKEVAEVECSAKDFRTWHATVLAATLLAEREALEAASSAAARRRTVGAVVKEVAEQLGNTPAVARASYIDPRVVDRYTGGLVIDLPAPLREADGHDGTEGLQHALEGSVLALLGEGSRRAIAA